MSENFETMLKENCFCPEHKIGDSIFYLGDHSFSDEIGSFELKVRENKNAVEKILITEQGFAYGDNSCYEPFAYGDEFEEKGTFWTREDAENYLKTLDPMINIFKEGDVVYYKNPRSERISEAEVMGFSFYNGNFKYMTDAGFEFDYTEIGQRFFKTKEELQKTYSKEQKTM